jgi:hypothetical protein
MGQCSCDEIPFEKYIKSGDEKILIGVYEGCTNCETPIGIELITNKSSIFEDYVESAEELTQSLPGEYCIPMVDYKKLRKELINVFNEIIPEIRKDSELTADEIFSDYITDDDFMGYIQNSMKS